MYPHERSLVRHLSDKPFAIIGVNSDRDLQAIKATTVEKHITWRSFWNGEKGTGGPISKKWNVSGWPTTYLIDKEGVIRFKNVRGKALDQAIETLMGEMGEQVALADIDHEAEDEKALAELENGDKDKEDAPEKDADQPEKSKAAEDGETDSSDKKSDKAKESAANEAGDEKPAEAKADEAKSEAESPKEAASKKEDADADSKEKAESKKTDETKAAETK